METATDTISITIQGKAQTKGSWIPVSMHMRDGRQRTVMRPDNPKMKAWCDAIALDAASQMAGAEPWPDAVAVYGLGTPAAAEETPQKKRRADRFSDGLPDDTPSDLDKIQRAIGDALQNVVYLDDAQIVEWHARKVWHDEPGQARTEIHVVRKQDSE